MNAHEAAKQATSAIPGAEICQIIGTTHAWVRTSLTVRDALAALRDALAGVDRKPFRIAVVKGRYGAIINIEQR